MSDKNENNESNKEFYLDNSASTRMRTEALEDYRRVATENYGNPSSLHSRGFEAKSELDRAREIILATVGTNIKDSQIVFTASGTEANNLAILGRAFAKTRYRNGAKLICSAGEHASVSSPLAALTDLGYRVAELPTVGGEVDMAALERELTKDTVLVSVMMVNNETGAVYDLPHIARLVHDRCPEALFHVDATQGYMKLPFTKKSIGADMITLSSHKIGGPKGVGALIIDRSVIKAHGIAPLMLGGGQEDAMRSGTENVPGIAAFATAARLAQSELPDEYQRLEALRAYLIRSLGDDALAEISITDPQRHAPHILNITLPNIKSETMLHYLSAEGIYVSSGSACSSHGNHVSSALTSYGRSAAEADHSIRISLGRENTEGDIDALCAALKRGLSALARVSH